jgi:hypothetical protein
LTDFANSVRLDIESLSELGESPENISRRQRIGFLESLAKEMKITEVSPPPSADPLSLSVDLLSSAALTKTKRGKGIWERLGQYGCKLINPFLPLSSLSVSLSLSLSPCSHSSVFQIPKKSEFDLNAFEELQRPPEPTIDISRKSVSLLPCTAASSHTSLSLPPPPPLAQRGSRSR